MYIYSYIHSISSVSLENLTNTHKARSKNEIQYRKDVSWKSRSFGPLLE